MGRLCDDFLNKHKRLIIEEFVAGLPYTLPEFAFRDSGAQISSSFFLDAILHSCVATIRETNHERTTLKVKAAVNGLINVK